MHSEWSQAFALLPLSWVMAALHPASCTQFYKYHPRVWKECVHAAVYNLALPTYLSKPEVTGCYVTLSTALLAVRGGTACGWGFLAVITCPGA